ncbi:MAG: beta-N-acetylhexosaminidase [Lentisphaerae bacterium]|nr:beta-N-acetylhexosaminidase [Lentisphaerota bacterium]
MNIALIPQPQRVQNRAGTLVIPSSGVIGIDAASLYPVARRAARRLPRHTIASARGPGHDTLSFRFATGLRPGGYRLVLGTNAITIEAESPAAADYAVSTLFQILDQSPDRRLPCCRIEDWPAFPVRGVYYDVARGRVPTLTRLVEQASLLSTFKVNHLQHYIEHTFQFRGHPLIGRGASPLTPHDILQLDATCRDRHIELVPSLASFGHMATVLHHPPYRHLAEDWGENRYLDPAAEKHASFQKRRAWSLAPANPASYTFLEELYAEFLPLFSSRQFNVCCDETLDLCLGQSYPLARRRGKGRVYLDHLLKLRRLSRRHDKRIMFWGDIIHHYPERIAEIPRDVTVLDWGYDHRTRFDKVAAFQKAGLPFLACPGTSSWISLFPRLHEATAAIQGYTQAAVRHQALGVLNTDWGDDGHFNFMEYSWHGYLFGAEQAWNPRADQESFTARFARIFLNTADREVARAITTLGDVAHLGTDALYQSLLYHVYVAAPDSPLFRGPRYQGWTARGGHIQPLAFTVNAALGRQALAKLEFVRDVLSRCQRAPGTDPHAVLAYWLFAVDTLAHAARKLTVLAPGGHDTPRARAQLRRDMRGLMARFQRLWLARNRPSEIGITLKKYRTAMAGL